MLHDLLCETKGQHKRINFYEVREKKQISISCQRLIMAIEGSEYELLKGGEEQGCWS